MSNRISSEVAIETIIGSRVPVPVPVPVDFDGECCPNQSLRGLKICRDSLFSTKRNEG